jgi:hypothetical protein
MPGLLPSFQRPTNKRRSTQARHQEEALRQSSLGPRKRMDGMQKLLARAGKGLAFRLPAARVDGDTEDDDSHEDETDEEPAPERPFEPLRVWQSPHEGGELKGLPPRL